MSPDQLFNEYLHGARFSLLGRLAAPTTMVSAGCNGTPYFEWVERAIGFRGRHIGVEYYCEKPNNLPANVEWISNTVGDMHEIEGDVCELLFSGQNIEHLWPEEVCGFLAEAYRILNTGGLLVLDSPNRLITADQKWTHPEHTLELTVAEAQNLLELAGFEVRRRTGLWLCRDRNGQPIPLFAEGPCSAAERLVAGLEEPERCFIWWIEAMKGSRRPDPLAVKHRLEQIYASAWDERISRLSHQLGSVVRQADGTDIISSREGEVGYILYGPYLPLRAGKYSVSMDVRVSCHGAATVDILAGGSVLGERSLQESGPVVFEFELKSTTFGFEYRVFCTGGGAVSVAMKLCLVAM